MERVPQEIHVHAVKTLTEKIERASGRLGKEISVGGDDRSEGVQIPELSLTPEGTNFARTLVPVRVAGEHVLNAWVIAFRPGDGTGNDSGFAEGSLILPEHLSRASSHGDLALYPRPKTGITAEICVPLANAAFGHFYKITKLGILTVSTQEEGPTVTDAGVYLDDADSFITLGTDNFGRRVGDPHALFYPATQSLDSEYGRTALEVVAFLPSLNGEDYELDLLAAFNPTNPYTV